MSLPLPAVAPRDFAALLCTLQRLKRAREDADAEQDLLEATLYGDPTKVHELADEALLAFIGDPAITDAFRAATRYYG